MDAEKAKPLVIAGQAAVLAPRRVGAEASLPAAPARRQHHTLRRLRRSFSGLTGAMLLASVTFIALAASVLAPQGYAQQDLVNRLQPPAWMEQGSLAHPLGTDPLGRDLWSRMVWAARVSLGIAGVSVLVAMSVGVLVGLLTGFYGGWLDAVMMRIADVQLSFPYLLLAIAVMALLKPSLTNLVILLALPGWMVYARTVRGVVLGLKRREFVEAALALGASDRRVIFRHLAPNVLAPVIVISSFQFAQIIIAEASLSFLGVGVQPPIPSWGAMLSQGREYLSTAWWLGIFPGLAIMIAVLGTNLFGDGLRDALDPRLKL
ncbi:MAG TPA: ABC transporter permease [Chloroflexota bacterium]|nr:ABC transporter permease [Chloroflexota bacterium]